MKRLLPLLCLFAILAQAADQPKIAPLPLPISNSAVAATRDGKDSKVYSFMGVSTKKTWDAVTNRSFELDLNTGKWTEKRSVPGVAGRLAASAVAVKEQIFVFGGYVVDGQGGENTLSDLNVYVTYQDRWYRGDDLPVPIDDSVAGVYRDRFIYLISGWSKTDATNKVQIYDTEHNKWLAGTPIPGTPVFGHAGGIAGDTIIYVDGAYKNPTGSPRYLVSNDCWMGKISKGDPTKIEWTKLPPHPGGARYRIASAGSDRDGKIYFSGGTDNPYNYNGVGYDGQPSLPTAMTFDFNVKAGKWETINENTPDSTMDNRTLAVTPRGLVIVGGMDKSQQVLGTVRLVKPTPAK